MTKQNKKKTARFLNIAGEILIVMSIFGLFLTFGPVISHELTYHTRKVMGVKYTADRKMGISDDKQIVLEPPNLDFSIIIPEIGAVAPIIANVDPGNPDIFLPALRRGVAHAEGSALPGESGNVYLFAHSTDAFYNVGNNNAVFYLIGKLNKGDEIDIYYKGTKHIYSVDYKKVVEPEASKYLGDISKTNTLTLQTCYPPGTTLKRLVVVASNK